MTEKGANVLSAKMPVLVLALLSGAAAQGAALSSRAQLQALLGGAGTVEDFESYAVAAGTGVRIQCPFVTSTAICDGQGPGLVVPGVQFGFSREIDPPLPAIAGQWNGAGYLGSASKELTSATLSGLNVTFTVPVTAFGIDVRTFTGFAANANVTIYGTDNSTVLGTITSVPLASTGLPVFLGWHDVDGIGRVFFDASPVYSGVPPIDNLEFGVAVIPLPASIWVLGGALGALGTLRRRKY